MIGSLILYIVYDIILLVEYDWFSLLYMIGSLMLYAVYDMIILV